MSNLNGVAVSNVFENKHLILCGHKDNPKFSAMKKSTGILLLLFNFKISTVSVLKLLGASRPRRNFCLYTEYRAIPLG